MRAAKKAAWARYRHVGAIDAHLATEDPFGFLLTACGRRFRPSDVLCATRRWPLCGDCAKTVRIVSAPDMPGVEELAE